MKAVLLRLECQKRLESPLEVAVDVEGDIVAALKPVDGIQGADTDLSVNGADRKARLNR